MDLKQFGSKNILSLKIFLDQKQISGQKQILGPKHILGPQQIMGPKQISGSKKNVGLAKIYNLQIIPLFKLNKMFLNVLNFWGSQCNQKQKSKLKNKMWDFYYMYTY